MTADEKAKDIINKLTLELKWHNIDLELFFKCMIKIGINYLAIKRDSNEEK